MEESGDVFVETTAQIMRLFGTQEIRNRMGAYLRGKRVWTSATVYMEFVRTMIRAFWVVKGTLEECEPDHDALIRLGDIDRWLSDSNLVHSERQARLLFKVTAALKDNFPDEDDYKVSCRQVTDYLDRQIETLLNRLFFLFEYGESQVDLRAAERFINLTNCGLMERLGADQSVERLSCNSKREVCSTHQLIFSRKDELESVKTAFAACEDERRDGAALEALEKIWREILEEGKVEKSLGEKICWKLGDVFIGMECPHEAHLLTKDKHFSIICPALKKVLLPIDHISRQAPDAS
jgi:hypothetical protein